MTNICTQKKTQSLIEASSGTRHDWMGYIATENSLIWEENTILFRVTILHEWKKSSFIFPHYEQSARINHFLLLSEDYEFHWQNSRQRTCVKRSIWFVHDSLRRFSTNCEWTTKKFKYFSEHWDDRFSQRIDHAGRNKSYKIIFFLSVNLFTFEVYAINMARLWLANRK